MNYKSIERLLGIVLIVLSFAMASSIVWSVYFDEPATTTALAIAAMATFASGYACYFFGRRQTGAIGRREALVVVTASWFLIGAFGALPYLFDGAMPSFADAFFESVSGFTTTGSTVLTEIESLSHGLHYWRTLTHWLGGMGIVVLFIAIFPQLGVGAKHLFKSEVPGPITEGLKPKIKETASVLWKIYLGLTVVEIGLLYLAGMSFFDAMCHAFATLATGGFSTKNASIAYYDSASVDLIVTFFMFLAGVNFGLYYAFFKGRFTAIFRDTEFRVYTSIFVLVSLAITVDILSRHPNFWQALRYSSFQTIAIVTTTGFATDDFNLYPDFARTLLVVLMFMGGSAGSTAGGMKVSRIIVVTKAAFIEIYKTFRPNAVRSVKLGNSVMSDDLTKSIYGFFALFLFMFVAGTLIMTLLGLDLVTASTSVIATLGNIGPGLERVGAVENFAFIPATGKYFLSFCMILGRLELFTVFVLFVPDFWKR